MNKDSGHLFWELESDVPLVNPADDAYGYAPFASQLAEAIVKNKSPQGLVLAVHGKWGSGKSSLLNFIKHELNQLPEGQKPIIIDFNPWWFEGRNQIATQLLSEFSSQLPDNLKLARQTAGLIGKYSKEIATTAANYSGHAWVGTLTGWLAGYIPKIKALTEPEGVPKVKKKVAKTLQSFGKRIVFFVDDIDRLTPDESSDFFRAVKALADFPEVIYVLFFDREEVAKALTASLKMDGEAYLEKIVQAPFHLPAVDSQQLQKKLFNGLDLIIEANKLPFTFDQGRWAELYMDGLSLLIKKPRDIVRILNAISITYPPLAGEVNPVDFIALEFLRIFEPSVYDSIRDAKQYFCGLPSQFDHKRVEEKAYFEAWKASVPERSRDCIVGIVSKIFPKVQAALGANKFASNGDDGWRKQLRPCSLDNYDVYFQFGIPPGHVSQAELDRLISQDSSEDIISLLLEAKDIVFSDGHSKARDLIDRLRDYDDLSSGQVTILVKALVDSGHLLLAKDDERGGFFSMPNRWRISGLICRLLEKLPISQREDLLMGLAKESPGLWCLVNLADDIMRASQDPSKGPKALTNLSKNFPVDFSRIVGGRLDMANLSELMKMPDLDFVIYRWREWGSLDRIREVFAPMIENDDDLIALLEKFLRTGTKYAGNVVSETYRLSMKPLAIVVDVHYMATRVSGLSTRPNLSVSQQAIIKRFRQGLNAMDEGKDPDDIHFEDDDE